MATTRKLNHVFERVVARPASLGCRNTIDPPHAGSCPRLHCYESPARFLILWCPSFHISFLSLTFVHDLRDCLSASIASYDVLKNAFESENYIVGAEKSILAGETDTDRINVREADEFNARKSQLRSPRAARCFFAGVLSG
jgi:hypothetical protein